MDTKFATAQVKALDTPNWMHGSFEATISAPELDRDGEIIDSGAFHPLPESIPIFGDHAATIATTVARAVPYYEGDQLKAKGNFGSDDYSQLVRQKLKEGLVTTMSVGFMAPVSSPDEKGVNHITKAELLEASFVPIPSLRQATVSMAKGLADDLLVAATLETTKAGARNSKADQGYIQNAHDALCLAGAECVSKSLEDEPETEKSVIDPGTSLDLDIALAEVEVG
jgi:HK97 family phage prohead protease